MISVDVVITTYNRHGPLTGCLEALSRQTVAPTRVIVVDDCSEPPVERTISAAVAGRLQLTVVRSERNGGPATGRNAGIRESTAERILFVDDDVVATQELVEHHARWHEQGPSSVVIGPLAAPRDWKPTAWNLWEARKLDMEYQKMCAGAYAPTWRQFFTGNASVRRRDLVEVGGFDERFTRAEDIELGIRLAKAGCRFIFDPEAIGWHYAVRTKESWLRIPREYARFDGAIARLHPELRWSRVVAGNMASRHPLTRAASAGLSAVHGQRIAAKGAVAVATHLHSLGVEPAAQSLLSLAFALEYNAANREPANGLDVVSTAKTSFSGSSTENA